jgi:hypothetical protein
MPFLNKIKYVSAFSEDTWIKKTHPIVLRTNSFWEIVGYYRPRMGLKKKLL